MLFLSIEPEFLWTNSHKKSSNNSRQGCSVKELFSKILQTSPQKTCNWVLFLLKSFIKNRSPLQVLSYECCKFSKNSYSIVHLLTTGSDWIIIFIQALSLGWRTWKTVVLMLQKGALLLLKYANLHVFADFRVKKKGSNKLDISLFRDEGLTLLWNQT